MDNFSTRFGSLLAGRYTIERELGRGGMATVYLARDSKHERAVAIKVLDPELGAVLGVERFLSEIKVTANLQHPNLLPLFDSGEVGGRLFYVMPYIEGETLRHRLQRERQLPVDEAVNMTVMIAGALEFAHSRGVIHRDLKPENILLQAGQPVVADFGIALAASNAGGERVTQTGLSLGTPQYMSPEQASGEPGLDARSDQFSLAAMLYELLCGEPPHTGATPQVIVARLLSETARPVSATRASVLPHIDAAIMRALSKTPSDRFPNVRAFADALRQTNTVPVTPTVAHTRKRGLAAAAVLVLGVVVAGVVWSARGGGDAPLSDATLLMLPVATITDEASTSMASRVENALAEGISGWSWAQLRTATQPARDNAAAAKAARDVGAAIAMQSTLVSGGSQLELSTRLIDARTGQVVRQLPPVTLPQSADANTVRHLIEPLVVAAGFVTNRDFGVVTLPPGDMPSAEAFRAMSFALNTLRTEIGTPAQDKALASLHEAIASDSSFVQPKLWLGFLYGWFNYYGRWPGGVARADSVGRWVAEGRRSGSPYKLALADLAAAGRGEIGDTFVDALRRLIELTPRSPLADIFPALLLDLNRPREAIERSLATLTPLNPADSLSAASAASTWFTIAYAWHYINEYDSALVAIRNARASRPTDLAFLSAELEQLAAMGNIEELNRLLPDIGQASGEGARFGFAGNSYLALANELLAHGQPEEAAVMGQRALTWFESQGTNSQYDNNVAVRHALTLAFVGKPDEAIALLESRVRADTSDSRLRGLLGRLYVQGGQIQIAQAQLAWLEARPAEQLQGAPTYERASIVVAKGREHWDEAIALLELSLRQGQGYGIRRRLHYFADWLPLKDYPPFKRILEPRG